MLDTRTPSDAIRSMKAWKKMAGMAIVAIIAVAAFRLIVAKAPLPAKVKQLLV